MHNCAHKGQCPQSGRKVLKKEKVSIFSPRQFSTNSSISLDNSENSENIGTIETSALDDLLEKCNDPNTFGFLNTDIEGADLQVLKSINLIIYKPTVIYIKN